MMELLREPYDLMTSYWPLAGSPKSLLGRVRERDAGLRFSLRCVV